MSIVLRDLRAIPTRHLHRKLKGFIQNRMWAQVLVAMALGILAGIALGPTTGWVAPGTAEVLTNWLALPGQLFLALVQMIVIPLVFASIVLGMAAGGNLRNLKQIGVRAMLFFLGTTIVAVLIGMAVMMTLEPGRALDAGALVATSPAVSPDVAEAPGLGELPGVLIELVPVNPLRSGLEQNMLQVVLMALLVGVALVSMAKVRAQPLLELLASVQEVAMTVVRWAMFLVPVAVFGLLAQITTRLGLDALLGMSYYVGTVLIGLTLMLGVYLVLYRVLTGKPVGPFMREARDVQLLAFSTSSSAAVLPTTLQTAEKRLGIDPSVSQFVIPLGTTINMAGTALYQVAATLFLAQVFAIDVPLASLLLVAVLAIGASIGSPGTPGIGIAILSMLLVTIGIPPGGIALVIGVDRILDMSRTVLNVTGDLVAASVVGGPAKAPRPAEPAAPEPDTGPAPA